MDRVLTIINYSFIANVVLMVTYYVKTYGLKDVLFERKILGIGKKVNIRVVDKNFLSYLDIIYSLKYKRFTLLLCLTPIVQWVYCYTLIRKVFKKR